MTLRAHLTGYRLLTALKSAALRTGIYTGGMLSAAMLLWLILANRAPWLERFAWERNVAGAAAVAILALVPLARFLKFPSQLFLSGITAWGIFSLFYRLYCFYFSSLAGRMGAFHLFMLGGVLYLFSATIAWIGTILWSIRVEHAAHTRHHTS
jgi:hypothetical protein